jgi:hypothetical protein
MDENNVIVGCCHVPIADREDAGMQRKKKERCAEYVISHPNEDRRVLKGILDFFS